MKRIGLYLGFPPNGGGAFQYASSMLEALRALPNAEYHAVVAHAHQAWSESVCQTGIESHRVVEGTRDAIARLLLRFGLPASTWRRHAFRMGGMETQLSSLACDLWIFPAQDYLSYAMQGPTVGTIHDLMHRHERGFPEVSALGLYHRRERHYRNMCESASAILVDSQTGRQHVLDAYRVAPERIHVLPYVAPVYIHAKGTPADFDDRYRLPAQYLFYPAQFWRHKNHVRLIEALALAKRRLPKLSLVLAGSPKNNGTAIEDAIRRLGLSESVVVLGYVPEGDMAELYRRSRGMVMPTFFGPTNIPPLEAMATATPMALSDIYAMREQSGDAAIYFDPLSVASIAEAMIALAGDEALRQRLSSASSARHAQLSQSLFNAQLTQILRQIVPT